MELHLDEVLKNHSKAVLNSKRSAIAPKYKTLVKFLGGHTETPKAKNGIRLRTCPGNGINHVKLLIFYVL